MSIWPRDIDGDDEAAQAVAAFLRGASTGSATLNSPANSRGGKGNR